MNRMFPRHIAAALCLLLLCPPANAQPVTYPTSTLSIRTQHGLIHLSIQVAASERQQEHGLMYRRHLARDHGMLFVFAQPQSIAFWMKGTLIPLDMLFIDDSGVISKIVQNAPPLSLKPIPSDSDRIHAVLELGGGTAAYYHIAKGDKVLYSGNP